MVASTKVQSAPQPLAAAAHATELSPAAAQKTSPIKEIARSPTRATAQQHNQIDTKNAPSTNGGEYDPNECAGCGDQLKEGQALIALERQWHIWCFR